MGNELNLIKVELPEDAAKPLNKLISVVAQGIGGLYRPLGMLVEGHVEAHVKILQAQTDIKVQELQRRALERVLFVETERQKNIENIVEKAKLELPSTVDDVPVRKDWTTSFFSAAQDVTDEDLQFLWGRILAQEVAQPESISKRTLEQLKMFDPIDAKSFEIIVSVSFESHPDGWRYIVADDSIIKAIYSISAGDSLAHIQNIGLIAPESMIMEAQKINGRQFCYGEDLFQFVKSSIDSLDSLGGVFYYNFTSVGQELAEVIKCMRLTGLIERLAESESLKHYGIRIEKVGPRPRSTHASTTD